MVAVIVYFFFLFDTRSPFSHPLLIENLILGGVPSSMICDITDTSNPGPIFSQCDVETRSLQCTYTQNRQWK